MIGRWSIVHLPPVLSIAATFRVASPQSTTRRVHELSRFCREDGVHLIAPASMIVVLMRHQQDSAIARRQVDPKMAPGHARLRQTIDS